MLLLLRARGHGECGAAKGWLWGLALPFQLGKQRALPPLSLVAEKKAVRGRPGPCGLGKLRASLGSASSFQSTAVSSSKRLACGGYSGAAGDGESLPERVLPGHVGFRGCHGALAPLTSAAAQNELSVCSCVLSGSSELGHVATLFSAAPVA